jgi:cytochrome c biogenesis protein CcmG/thiol:disulfide interchange protein DsbE
MSKSIKFLTPLVLFLGLAALLFYGLGTDPRMVPSPLVGKPAPKFSLPALLEPNRTVSDADLKGKISLVNVWASWCLSCRAEHEELMKLSREVQDIQILGLNWKDDAGDAASMLRMYGDPYVVSAFDPDNKAGIDWGVYGAPETFVVDRNGIIRYKHIGPIDRAVWEQTLRPLIDGIKAQEIKARS